MSSTKKYNSHSGLSREDISSYLDTKSGKQRNSIEQKSMENEFDELALQGWEESGASLVVMKKMDQKFLPKSQIWIYLIAGVLILLIGLSFLFNFASEQSVNEVLAKKVELKIEKTDFVLPESINNMEEAKSSLSIKPTILKATFKNKSATLENLQTTFLHQESDLVVTDLPILKEDLLKKLDEVGAKKIITSSQAKEIYLHELKLVDYRVYRSRPEIKAKMLVLTGVPADLESNENTRISSESEWKDIQIPYYDYTKKTQLLFSQGKYKNALSRYLTILETYPDDVNALFYSGLCYYNLKEYVSSNENFAKCLQSKFNNFNEEAEWFMALTYQSSGEFQKSEAVLKLISEKGGYYSDQAKKQLKKVK